MRYRLGIIIFMWVLLMPAMLSAREDHLALLLEQCLLREENSPDSIEYNLELLEKEREGTSGVRRAVFSAALAQLYAMRAYSDVTGQWRSRSKELFREALADPALLYDAQTKDWLPVVRRGKDDKIYGRNMLYVVWRAAHNWGADSIMSEQELLDFYTARGNRKPSEVKSEYERLRTLNDSIWEETPRLKVSMAEVYYPGDSLGLVIDSFNIRQLEWRVLDSRGKLVGKNMMLAPTQLGRYMLEVKCKTNVRLEKKLKPIRRSFVVSTLQFITMDMPGKQKRVVVVDARSGKPRPEATVIKNKETQMLRVVCGADSCLPELRYYERYNYNAPSTKEQPRVAIYTDRAIYRPGQMVHLSAILYSVKHWEARVREPKECKVQLLDGRTSKLLADTMVCSDELGVLGATLQIPENIELGWHTLKVDGTIHSIRVEEYKRPTFYVEMDEKDKEVSIPPMEEPEVEEQDSMITISGRAMNWDGTPLRGGRVTATARRIACWWWRGRTEDVRRLDTVYTDVDGGFVLTVLVSRNGLYRYAPMLRIEASVLSAQGETQIGHSSVRLFADPPMEVEKPKAKEWMECPVDTFDARTPAQLEFRAKEGEERCVFLTAFAGESVLIDTMMIIQDTLSGMQIPYKTEYADGLLLKAYYVSNGIIYIKQQVLRKRLPETRLLLHWDTFRDYTQPGAMEHWTLRVMDTKGKPAVANVMLGMYDASLEAFGKHRWELPRQMNHCIPYAQTGGYNWYSKQWTQQEMNFDVWEYDIPTYDYSSFNEQYFARRGVRFFKGGWTSGTMRTLSVGAVSSRKETVTLEENALADTDGMPEALSEEDVNQVVVRSDFSETAMFMPQLRTDAEGRVAISFRVPQSLTTWRLNALAHTRDMMVGTLSEDVVARKALTAKVHLPRFVREKDILSFSVQVSNTGTSLQNGRVQVLVTDAQTDKVLMKKTVKFTLAHESDTTYTFTYPVADGLMGLKFKVVALAEKDSDGEQREIPVLSSVVGLTETKALTLAPGQSEDVDLTELFPADAKDRVAIVERITDPIQVALDALPRVAQPTANDVLSYASAYYAAHKLGLADTTIYINKVYTMQKSDGSMPWFDGLAGNAYLTREVGFLLARLGSDNVNARKILTGIKRYLRTELEKSLDWRKDNDKDWIPWLSDLRTLYVLVKDGEADKETLQLVKKVLKRLPDNLAEMDSEYIAIAMIVKHALKEAVLKDGVAVLRSRLNHKDGVYLAYRGGSWPGIDRRLHIHTQVMEAWQTVCPGDSATLRGMQYWLLNQKRTQGWKSPIECIDAVYALTGGDISIPVNATPCVQRDTIDLSRKRNLILHNDKQNVMWAAVYAEYTLPIDKVRGAEMDLGLERTFDVQSPKVGDRITETIIIDARRDYEYVLLSIPRAGCAEPVSKLSGYGWHKGLSYYVQVRDDRTDYYIPALPHGKYVIETEMLVERSGEYATGIPTIQCCYAEEFRAHITNEMIKPTVSR